MVKGFDVDMGGFKYTTDPWAVWADEGSFVRWPHNFKPTHWMPLPQSAEKPDRGMTTNRQEEEDQQLPVYQYYDGGRDCYWNCIESEYMSSRPQDRRIGWATIAKPEHVAGEQS